MKQKYKITMLSIDSKVIFESDDPEYYLEFSPEGLICRSPSGTMTFDKEGFKIEEKK